MGPAFVDPDSSLPIFPKDIIQSTIHGWLENLVEKQGQYDHRLVEYNKTTCLH